MSASDNSMMVSFMKTILEKFNWTTVSLLCDISELIVPFYTVMCTNLGKSLRSGRKESKVFDVRFNAVNQTDAQLYSTLDIVATSSRGITKVHGNKRPL